MKHEGVNQPLRGKSKISPNVKGGADRQKTGGASPFAKRGGHDVSQPKRSEVSTFKELKFDEAARIQPSFKEGKVRFLPE